MTTEEIFSTHGFSYYGKCACNGIPAIKYRRGKDEVRWRKNRFTFQINKGVWYQISQLNEILEKQKAEIVLG